MHSAAAPRVNLFGLELTLDKVFFAFTAVSAIAFTALWFLLRNLPLHDMPNHAARGLIMADLLFHGGRTYGELFELDLRPQPYILGDLLLAALSAVTPTLAGRAITWLSFIGLPAAAWFYARSLGLSTWARAGAALAAGFIATDISFTLGFLGYRLSLPLLLMALVAAEQLLRRLSVGWLLAYAACTLAGFLMHLAMPVLLIPTVGALAFVRYLERRFDKPVVTSFTWSGAAVVLALPLLLVVADRLIETPEAGPMVWLSLPGKITMALGMFSRLEGQWPRGRFLVLVFGLIPLMAVVARGFRHRLVREQAVMAAVLAAVYLVLPTNQGMVFGIDLRAAPLVFFFAAMAGICSVDRSITGLLRPAVSVLLMVVTALNFVALAGPMRALDNQLGDVRQALSSLPAGTPVLPVRAPFVYQSQMLHAGAFAVLDRGSLTPYVFSGDQGLPQKYFRYRHRPYAPSEFWAMRGLPIDWERTRKAWPYLLVIGGTEADLDTQLPMERVSANRTATLLRFKP